MLVSFWQNAQQTFVFAALFPWAFAIAESLSRVSALCGFVCRPLGFLDFRFSFIFAIASGPCFFPKFGFPEPEYARDRRTSSFSGRLLIPRFHAGRPYRMCSSPGLKTVRFTMPAVFHSLPAFALFSHESDFTQFMRRITRSSHSRACSPVLKVFRTWTTSGSPFCARNSRTNFDDV